MEVIIVNNIVEFFNKATEAQELYYLIKRPHEISDFLENSGLDDNILMNIKLAYNIEFKGYILDVKEDSKKEVNSIEEVLNKLDVDYADSQNLILEFDDIDTKLTDEEAKLLTDIIQQFIFLNLDDLEIFTEQERRNKKIYDKFRKNYDNLKLTLSNFENKVLKYKTDDKEIISAKETLEVHIKEINDVVNETKARKLIISVVALRNAGKSVIVNSFLGQEFAPTSEEDSTPNAIAYESWDKDYVELKIESDSNHKAYKKETIEKFKTTKEVYDYLNDLFKKVNKSDEKYLPDIYIKYPGKLDYIIVDTPGPNKHNTTEHTNISDKWLEKSDAVIVAIEYGDNEEKNALELLQKVQETLRKKDKLQSLLIVANKLDRMYNNEHTKSKVRYLDKSISFLNKENTKIPLVMMATSALEYFYMNQYIEILKRHGKTKDSKNMDTLINKLKPKDLSSKETTIRKFIKDQVGNLEDFHYQEDIEIKDIMKHSNMEAFIKRVEYIATNKAFDEIFSSLFYNLDEKFTSLENEFIAKEMQNLQKYKKEIEEKLDSVEKFFESKKKEVDNIDGVNTLKSNVVNSIDETYDDISQNIIDEIRSALDEAKYEIDDKKRDRINAKEVFDDDMKQVIQKKLNSAIENINSYKSKYVSELEKKVIDLNIEIKNEIGRHEFNERYGLELSLTELSPKLRKEAFTIDYNKLFNKLDLYRGISLQLEDIVKKEKYTETQSRQKDGFINSIFAIFGMAEYEDIEVAKERDVIDNEQVNNELERINSQLVELISPQLEDDRKVSKEGLEGQLNGFTEIIKSNMEMIISNYEKTNRNIRYMLNEDKETTEQREIFFQEIFTEFDGLKKIVFDIKQVNKR